MKAAVLKAMLLYVIGFSAAAFIYLEADSHYAHGPNLYHLVFVFTIFLGFVWLLITLGRYYIHPRKHLIGYLYVNGAAVLIFAIFIGLIIYKNKKQDESFAMEDDEISVVRLKDTTSLYHGGNIIYYRIKDSVYFDFRNAAARKIDLK